MIELPLYIALLQAKPDCGAPFRAGLEAYGKKDLSQALIEFRAAVACDAKLVAAHLAIADLYAERGNEAEALAALLRALEIEPKNRLALGAASTLYLKNGLHNKALPLLETLVGIEPRTAAAHADLAAVYAASGNREGAEKQFQMALDLEPNYFPALAGLGNLLARSGEQERAMPLLRKAVAAQPKAFAGHFLLGSALNRMNQFAEARAELEQAIALGGKREAQVFYQLARACGGLGMAEERRAALAKFSELSKQEKESEEAQRQANARIDEARVLLQENKLEAAVERLELAREARPGDATLLFRLAGLHFDLQRFDTAREYAQAAISISPSTWLYHYLLGLTERSANHLADAKASLETAAKLAPTEAPVFNALGEVLLEQGQKAKAIENFALAVKLAPENSTYRKNLEFAKR